ncbi:hypothetical protein L6164_024412 [Bauhinia variegata]|uniref:Uncharacterized protein n=1 Tax=Bauhinia variegata TaxID=167791 RepID=A0ACB9LXQ0_BAUVA|nr:hypothetical protein L6164_024412 [Bauhinia variegata]
MMESPRAKLVQPLTLILYWSLCLLVAMAQTRNTTVAVKVGVVLDLDEKIAKMGLSCINMSLTDLYYSHSNYNTRLVFNVRDSRKDVVTAAAQALDLIKEEQVQAIIGPISSMEAGFIIGLGDKAHVPILSFSATSPSLTSLGSPYFFRIAQNDSAQVDAIGAIVQAFGWREAVPIYIDNEFGKGVIPFLTNALQKVYARIPYLSAISPSATDQDIRTELYKLMTMQTRVFVVHMGRDIGPRLFTIAKQIGMMEQGYVWIVSDGIANELTSSHSSVIESMEGVLGVKTYIPRTQELDDFKIRSKRKFLQDYPDLVDTTLNVFGIWAYDATTALAMAVEKVGSTNFGFRMRNDSSNLTDLERFGISDKGEELREALSNTKFKGLSGEFNVVDGQLQASTFEIINVMGNGERRVGFWTSQNGLVRNLGSINKSTYSASKNNLGPIIWPGDSSSVPKGWENPTNANKFRIGVPVKDGYTEFLKIELDSSTNTTHVTGFCIAVFEAVIKVLPYALPYELIPFDGTYNELVTQVYFGKFDAVVGDTTIIANRSNYVDYTLPYTESGVTMVVPIKEGGSKNPWTFLKPLTWDLWATSACSFLFIGFVIWVLEHRINEKFRGPPSYQIGTSLWFSFSVMVFAHREKIVSNLGRFVVTVWVFVVLILIQSYTASLTSLLTVEQLRPAFTDVNQLIKNRLNVGYLKGSFVYGMLKEMGFQDFQLKVYNSTEHCDELFMKGSANGGIVAAFDEIPCVKLFLAKYCFKYAMVEPRFKTGGFGFVFPKDSPLVADISRAILNVTQGDEMTRIERAWFQRSSCPESDAAISSSTNSLGLDGFWGLFLIAAAASLLALICFAVRFLYKYRHILLSYDDNTSVWKRIGILLRIFDEKDLSSHTFRNSESSSRHILSPVELSPTTHGPPSPFRRTEMSSPYCAHISPYAHAHAHAPRGTNPINFHH